MPSLGEAYLDHYERFFGKFTGRRKFEYQETSLQILEYPESLSDTSIFASLGLTKFQDQLGDVCEIFFSAPENSELVEEAVIPSLWFMLRTQGSLRGISYLRHLQRSVPEFYEKYRKSAVLLLEPYLLATGVSRVALGSSGRAGKLLMAVFLADQEVSFPEKNGEDALFTLWESEEVDVIDITRNSSV